jgi:phage baseplate assembly protein W
MDPQLLTDIRLRLLHRELRPVYTVESVERLGPARQGRTLDLGITSGHDNLAQAVIIRLLTPYGELSGLGHPTYGSRVHELIGRPNNETTRNLLRLRILETLKQEARIGEIVEAEVSPSPGRRSSVDVRLLVLPVGDTRTLTIGPFTLVLEQ